VTETSALVRGLRVAELAAEVGLAPDTIRYYERAGLLPAPARTASGYRAYDPAAVERLRFVRGAQRLGLRLKDIADLLAVRDTVRAGGRPPRSRPPPPRAPRVPDDGPPQDALKDLRFACA